jgi:hypothetical protein
VWGKGFPDPEHGKDYLIVVSHKFSFCGKLEKNWHQKAMTK